MPEKVWECTSEQDGGTCCSLYLHRPVETARVGNPALLQSVSVQIPWALLLAGAMTNSALCGVMLLHAVILFLNAAGPAKNGNEVVLTGCSTGMMGTIGTAGHIVDITHASPMIHVKNRSIVNSSKASITWGTSASIWSCACASRSAAYSCHASKKCRQGVGQWRFASPAITTNTYDVEVGFFGP